MPRFKTPDYGLKLIPVDFAQQVLPGTFEFALCHLVDNDLDLSTLRARYANDAGGAPAFDPAVLLKIVLLGYSRGLISSRAIATACRHNVLFMAVSGDSARLHAVRSAQPLPAHAGEDQDAAGRLLPRQARRRRITHRPDDAAHRFHRGQTDDRRPLRHRRAGVR